MKPILIVDDHNLVRRGIIRLMRDLLDDSVEFHEAADGQQALHITTTLDLGLILLDISIPGRNGLDVLRQIRQIRPELPVLVLSMYSDDQYAVRALRAGAFGYVTKDSPEDVLLSAVKTVLGGKRYVSPQQVELLAEAICETQDGTELHRQLSNREYQFASLLAAGKTMTEIAQELSLSIKTISTYRTRVLEKLNLKTNAEIISYCLIHGITS